MTAPKSKTDSKSQTTAIAKQVDRIQINNINDLQRVMTAQVEGVVAGDIVNETANTVFNGGGKILGIAKLKLEVAKLVGRNVTMDDLMSIPKMNEPLVKEEKPKQLQQSKAA